MTAKEISVLYVVELQKMLPDTNISWDLSMVFPESSLCTLHISDKNDPARIFSMKFNNGLNTPPTKHDIDTISDLAVRRAYPK